MPETGDFSRLRHFRRNMNVKSHSILFRVVAFIVCFSIFIGCCPTIFAENGGNASVVKYKTNGEIVEATLTEIGTFSDSEDTMIAMGDGTSGKVYLAALPEGAVPYQIIAYYTTSMDDNGLKIPYYYTKTYDSSMPASTIIENDTTIIGDMLTGEGFLSVGGGVFSKAVHFNDGFVLPTENVTGFVVYDFDDSGASRQGNIIYVQIPVSDEPEEPVTKTELEEAINSALPTSGYYTENDRWNGKITSKSAKGFWQDLKDIVDAADKVYKDENATQEQVNDALATLTAALPEATANLIPLEKVNATALYEALHADWRWYNNELQLGTGTPVSADNCTALTWDAYEQAKVAGQALLDELYDTDGNPTDANTFNRNDAVNTAAAAADGHKLVNTDAYNTAYENYLSSKAEAEALIEQYDPAKLNESDYSAETWAAYVSAYNVLKADMEYRIVRGTTEDYAMLKAFNGYYAYNESGQWTHYPAHIDALKDARKQLASVKDVIVSFTYINNFSAQYEGFRGTCTDLYVLA